MSEVKLKPTPEPTASLTLKQLVDMTIPQIEAAITANHAEGLRLRKSLRMAKELSGEDSNDE